ncbi:hypothetical protein BTW10_15805 [Chromohalobacter japonicus]|uniref:Uncharacterized protein n=1 Tax=Chromohalobacter japonicus TaxID=223900 RepID=A0A1Q8T974_9GAMM|nr:hypothetical protein [Chromohalobacter japonicus]OLO10231.1 hypothetical protein BTW10_15805 [Chromohalobacter japonicus]
MKSLLLREHRLPTPPAGDPAFAPLEDPRMYWPVQRARLSKTVREGAQSLGVPVELGLLRLWQHNLPGAAWVERIGLPRRAVELTLGDKLVLHVNPNNLVRATHWQGWPYKYRPTSSAFIWDCEWDLRRGDLRTSSRARFIADIDAHRDDLAQSEAFAKYMARLKAGKPWSSHQQGILLDSEARILTFLRVYLSFMDDMAARGFDSTRGKDMLGVAVTREGRLLKINRGLHRLAMAQHLGLPSVPVMVKAVHRQWWERVTQGAQGNHVLALMKENLADCKPESQPGVLTNFL